MSEAVDFRQSLYKHKRLNEWMFAACMLAGDGQLARQSCVWLRPEMFSDARLSKMWGDILTHGDGVRAINEQGLILDISKYATVVPDMTRYQEYARAIAEDYFFIQAGESVGKLAAAISKRDMAGMQTIIEKLRSAGLSTTSSGQTADEVGEAFEAYVAAGFRAIRTFIPDLDREIGGLFAGEFTTIAARPGCGKTSLALQLARTCSANGLTVDLFSMEMQATQLWARMACPAANVEWTKLRLGEVTAEEKQRVIEKSQELRKKYGDRLRIIDDVYMVEDVHRISVATKPNIVLIDQLGEFRWSDPRESKVSYYGKIIRYLKSYVAADLGIPVVMLHHINRAPETRDDDFPTLADLRDSGEVEQKSDAVWLCHRMDLKKGKADGQVDVPFEIRIGKNRQGNAGGKVVLNYNLKRQWFS